ncbi:hypothetical protein E4U22_000861 [Claviceps purpurea]|nr:hypothetical protein E4U47_007938 [Claviceps purpurea]KAG6310081.1 hypothetical protein E4U44_005942 [Claviceps purpurea]KAG6313532.1 hypothetical protein E4U22_000861 [Claviceps purpurea]
MGRKRRMNENALDELRNMSRGKPVSSFDTSAIHDRVDAYIRKKRKQPKSSMHRSIPHLFPATHRFNDSTLHGHNSPTPNQPGIFLRPVELGEDHSTFAAQQSDDDAEGSATAESAAGDIPGVSPAVSIAAAEAQLGPDVVHFFDNDCESEISWASSSGESSKFSDAPSPAESRPPEPVLPDDGPEDTTGEVFKMTEFLEKTYLKWPPENTTKIEVQVPKEMTLSAGQLALAAAFHHANISRKNYKAIVEALKQFESVEELRGLPDYADTLRQRFLGSLPLLAMRRKTLTLDKKKIESRKTDKEDFRMLDLESEISRYLSSEDNEKAMVRGLAHRTDGIVDHARQAQWWGESIRTTSGHCVKMVDDTVLFPSDFVRYRLEGDDRADASTLRWGRICWVGQDFTDTAIQAGTSGSHVIEIQAVHEKANLNDDMFTTKPEVKYSHCPEGVTELIVVEDEKIMISPSRVESRHIDVHIDYDFKPKKSQTFSLSNSMAPFRVRWFHNQAQRSWRHAMRTTPLRGEREIEVFGRAYLERHFTNTNMRSLPMFLFADGFGLFRNMYRAIEGLYLMPQYLPAADREKLSSLIPLALGPFGAKKADLYKALNFLCELEKGKYVVVNGESVFVCAFVGAFVGDMMEQQELSGCLGHQAINGCRYCLVKKDWGIKDDWHLMDTLDELFPCLDRIRSRPIDAAHSEYQGLSRVMLTLLYKDILTPEAAVELDDQFRKIQFPPGWRRLQSGNSHLESWRMLELAHGSIILPLVLRGWLKDAHIKPPLRSILREQGLQHFTKEEFSPHDPERFTASEWLVTAYWNWSQSLLYVCGPYSSEVAKKLPEVIRQGRAALSFLLQTLSIVERKKPQRRKNTKLADPFRAALRFLPDSSRSQTAPSNVSMDSQSQTGSKVLQDVMNQYDKKMNLPNKHAGVHLAEVAAEYGGCRMVFTLLGEALHKTFKRDILFTNFRDAAATLMMRMNDRMTIALLFQGAFEYDYPDISDKFKRLIKMCPSLAEAMNPKAMEAEEEEHRGNGTMVIADEDHQNPQALRRQKPCRQLGTDFVGITKSLKLKPSHRFFVKLRQTYERDYTKRFEVTLHQAELRWYQKVAFTTSNQKRFCFTVGNFVKISKGFPVDDDTQYGRLDGIFIHKRSYNCYLFAVVRLARRPQRGTPDAEDKFIRGRPIHKLESDQEIVGLGRIEAEDTWMVPVGEERFVHVEFNVDAR